MARLTVKSVEAMAPSSTRREIPDAYCPKLYLIVQPSGVKSWAIRYSLGGRTAKLTLGTYPHIDLKTARELGSKALRTVAEGRDPRVEKKPALAGDSVEAAVAQFTERHLARKYRPKSRVETERYLRKLVDKWGARKISDITRADVRALVEPLVDASPIAANRLHSITRTFFGWALDQDIIAASPCSGLKPPAGKEASRDRVLEDHELRRVWLAAEQMGAPFGAVVQLMILTGQRRGEVAGMRWDELDLAQRVWTLSSERTKNGRRHEVPLSPQAVAIIEALPRLSNEFAFSFGDKQLNCFRKVEELRKLVGTMPLWTLHDLRRTAASGMARLGVGITVIEKVLNHVSGSLAGIVGVYQRHEFAAEKRAALEKWAGHVTAIRRR
jgi:integrase